MLLLGRPCVWPVQVGLIQTCPERKPVFHVHLESTQVPWEPTRRSHVQPVRAAHSPQRQGQYQWQRVHSVRQDPTLSSSEQFRVCLVQLGGTQVRLAQSLIQHVCLVQEGPSALFRERHSRPYAMLGRHHFSHKRRQNPPALRVPEGVSVRPQALRAVLCVLEEDHQREAQSSAVSVSRENLLLREIQHATAVRTASLQVQVALHVITLPSAPSAALAHRMQLSSKWLHFPSAFPVFRQCMLIGSIAEAMHCRWAFMT